ncbi:MAG: hypothetical protein IT426_20605 [Pirellulales bacterium]|nr:hypothetical protein [Pirellulales bacterium]
MAANAVGMDSELDAVLTAYPRIAKCTSGRVLKAAIRSMARRILWRGENNFLAYPRHIPSGFSSFYKK